MKLDSLGRRSRNQSQPSGKAVELTPRVLRVLGALRRHHYLPTPFLFLYFKDEQGGYFTRFREVMSKLFHEKNTVSGDIAGPFVTRPASLNPNYGPNPEPAWYGLSAAGRAVAQAGKPVAVPGKRDPDHHRAMGGAIGASFELLAPTHGLEYLHLEDILADARCPEFTRQAKTPLYLKLRAGNLEPDDLFGFRDGDGKALFFVREDDRGTESFFRTDRMQSSFRAKLDRYMEFFGTRAYAERWGIPAPRVLIACTDESRVRLTLDYLKDKPHGRLFYALALPSFGRTRWRAPREPIAALFGDWQTIDGPKSLVRR